MRQSGLAPILIILFVAILGIGGYFVYQSSSLRVSPKADEVISPTRTTTPNPTTPTILTTNFPKPTPTPSPTLDPTANWNTYTDSQAGFSIKYPPQLKIEKKVVGQEVEFLNCGGGLCSGSTKVTLYTDYSGGSRREWLNGKFDLSTYNPYYEDLNVAGVNALVAVTRDPGSNNTVVVVIPKGNKVYLYSAPDGAIPPTQKPNLDFDKQILSTFKFTQ